jgi:hypothetical protein
MRHAVLLFDVTCLNRIRFYKDTYVGGTGALDVIIIIALITYGMVVILANLDVSVAVGVGAPY